MSGDGTTSAASSAGVDQPPPDFLTDQSPAPAAPTREGAAMLSQGRWAGVIAIIAMVTVSLCVLSAVGAMVYRVIIDGNSPITSDITGKLTMIGIAGVGALILALFGSNSLIATLMEKLL